MDQPFVLRLIRHAPTRGNQQKRYIGWTDESILPFQAEPDLALGNVIGSDLKRCRQTAAILFRMLSTWQTGICGNAISANGK